jgi:hypothetical protein
VVGSKELSRYARDGEEYGNFFVTPTITTATAASDFEGGDFRERQNVAQSLGHGG